MGECDGGDGWKYVVMMEFNDDNKIVHMYFRLNYAWVETSNTALGISTTN